jgi:hypothetical protein
MDVDAFASADLDIAWFDEEPPGEKGKLQWEETGHAPDRPRRRGAVDADAAARPELRVPRADRRHGNPRHDDEVKVVTGDIDHNPHLSEEGRRRALKKFEKEPLKLEARKRAGGSISPG